MPFGCGLLDFGGQGTEIRREVERGCWHGSDAPASNSPDSIPKNIVRKKRLIETFLAEEQLQYP